MEREKSILKKATALLMAEGTRALALIDQLRREEPVELLCSMFEVTRSCYYAHCHKRRSPDVARWHCAFGLTSYLHRVVVPQVVEP